MYLVYLLSAASPLSKSVGRTKVSAETSVGRLSVGIFADMSALSAPTLPTHMTSVGTVGSVGRKCRQVCRHFMRWVFSARSLVFRYRYITGTGVLQCVRGHHPRSYDGQCLRSSWRQSAISQLRYIRTLRLWLLCAVHREGCASRAASKPHPSSR